MASVFSKIIRGEIPCYKLAEDDHNIAFLDIFPIVKGHALVVPKIEVDKLFDLPEECYVSLMIFAKKVAKGIEKTIPCNRVSIHVIGLEVPHAHIHLIPINSMSDCNFANPKLKLSKSEFDEIADNIRKNILL
ncbi:MAG: HIT family protein [Bacteroidia bacterium]|nr:HIT family protein [Bacteroidia bacterium]